MPVVETAEPAFGYLQLRRTRDVLPSGPRALTSMTPKGRLALKASATNSENGSSEPCTAQSDCNAILTKLEATNGTTAKTERNRLSLTLPHSSGPAV